MLKVTFILNYTADHLRIIHILIRNIVLHLQKKAILARGSVRDILMMARKYLHDMVQGT